MTTIRVDISRASGRADDHVCTEGGDLDTALVMLGWDEVEMLENYFENPIWYEVKDDEQERIPLS